MKKILIVDDEMEIRKLVEVTLGSGDYEVLQAESGEEAIEIARAEKPHLIITDIIMPRVWMELRSPASLKMTLKPINLA